MKTIIVMLLLFLACSQGCGPGNSDKDPEKETDPNEHVTPAGGEKDDPMPPEPSHLDSTMRDTIMDTEIIIDRVADGPITEGPEGPPRIVIHQPDNASMVPLPVTLKFSVKDAAFREGIDKFKFWIDGTWRLIHQKPGEFSITGLSPGSHVLRIVLIDGPGYHPPVPEEAIVHFTVE